MPDKVNWKAYNYAHLMEQPTLFCLSTLALPMLAGHAAIAVH